MQIPRKFSSDKLMWNLMWIVIHFYVFNKTLLTFLHNFIFDKLVRFALDSLEVWVSVCQKFEDQSKMEDSVTGSQVW